MMFSERTVHCNSSLIPLPREGFRKARLGELFEKLNLFTTNLDYNRINVDGSENNQ